MGIIKKNLNYIFHVEVEGLNDKITREIIIDSNDTLASLAYILLSSLDALSHHMFKMNVKHNLDVAFMCVLLKDFQEAYIEEYLARDYVLWKFHLEEGDVIDIDYGFGGGWHFVLQLVERKVEETKYEIPMVLSGKGYGIIEDGTIELVKNIFAKQKLYNGIDYSSFINDLDKFILNYQKLKEIYERVEEV